MNSQEIREKYIEFFKSKGHAAIPSASLIPENDPTALFTTAGMHPLVPYLMGEKHPEGNRLVDAQKCVRTGDIDEVGNKTHHTFFEMLGNWSLGDYFKKEAIEMSWEFLTSPDWLGLDKDRIAVSVFIGDEDAPLDEESFNTWKSLGIPESRIAKLSKKNNWWGPAGKVGPCGPDSEMFYWVGDEDKVPDSFNDDNDSWVEIWNDVFMEYNKKNDGTYELLKQKNVDTGMGLERITAVLNKVDDNYKTDLFTNIINKIARLSKKEYEESEEITKAMRIIADHIRAAVFIIGDPRGVTPSNTDQGYVVRRLIRRAIRYGQQLGIVVEKGGWTKEVAKIVVHDYYLVYPELSENIEFIVNQFKEEEAKFSKTLETGLKHFTKMQVADNKISGKEAFNLYQTYGFPIEITKDLAKEKNWEVNEDEFAEELKKHQDLSRTASAGKFKGGLADASEETKKLHTAAHLLLAALRKVLGKHITQKGSNITAERLRFDFSHDSKMTDEEIAEVEKLVNEAIKTNLPVTCEEMPLADAEKKGAMGVFTSKYGEKVKVYKAGPSVSSGQDVDDKPFSYEICGGPHVDNTGELGQFKIKKEQSSSSGVRRIKAILE